MKLFRNLQHVRGRFGRFEQRIVPAHVYRALAPYADDYAETFDRPLASTASAERRSGDARSGE
jgi:coenzyme F420 hydrogenase subunit beta